MRRVPLSFLAAVVAVGVLATWLQRVPPRRSGFYPFPVDRECVVAIVDDTDGFQFATVAPVYALLDSLGLRVTKTVWTFDCDSVDSASVGLSLENAAYRDWVAREAARGHEIALHSPSCGDDDRETVLDAHRRLAKALGVVPRIETFHKDDQEALYWGRDRIPDPVLRLIHAASGGLSISEGHVPGSEFYWLDRARDLVRYAGGYTVNDVNTLALNPSMPYEDELTPLAPLWFASSNGRFGDRFVALLSEENVARLKEERGVTIVYAGFASGFTREEPGGNRSVRPDVRETLVRCGRDPAIEFVPAGDLLDRLRVIQLVEDLLAEHSEGGVEAEEGRSIRLELPRELLPALAGVSVDPERLTSSDLGADATEPGRVALVPWMARARVVVEIAPATVFSGARRIGWRERWRLVLRWMATGARCDT
jgi:hypothetical protein